MDQNKLSQSEKDKAKELFGNKNIGELRNTIDSSFAYKCKSSDLFIDAIHELDVNSVKLLRDALAKHPDGDGKDSGQLPQGRIAPKHPDGGG